MYVKSVAWEYLSSASVLGFIVVTMSAMHGTDWFVFCNGHKHVHVLKYQSFLTHQAYIRVWTY